VREREPHGALELLRGSRLPVVQELLYCASCQHGDLPPRTVGLGQAMDTALAICGLLLEGGHLNGQVQRCSV